MRLIWTGLLLLLLTGCSGRGPTTGAADTPDERDGGQPQDDNEPVTFGKQRNGMRLGVGGIKDDGKGNIVIKCVLQRIGRKGFVFENGIQPVSFLFWDAEGNQLGKRQQRSQRFGESFFTLKKGGCAVV